MKYRFEDRTRVTAVVVPSGSPPSDAVTLGQFYHDYEVGEQVYAITYCRATTHFLVVDRRDCVLAEAMWRAKPAKLGILCDTLHEFPTIEAAMLYAVLQCR